MQKVNQRLYSELLDIPNEIPDPCAINLDSKQLQDPTILYRAITWLIQLADSENLNKQQRKDLFLVMTDVLKDYSGQTTLLRGGITLMTGGPGTGKTNVIRTICRAMQLLGASVDLAKTASTGSAGIQMCNKEGGDYGVTVHSKCGYSVGNKPPSSKYFTLLEVSY
jgi:hypothetical protein